MSTERRARETSPARRSCLFAGIRSASHPWPAKSIMGSLWAVVCPWSSPLLRSAVAVDLEAQISFSSFGIGDSEAGDSHVAKKGALGCSEVFSREFPGLRHPFLLELTLCPTLLHERHCPTNSPSTAVPPLPKFCNNDIALRDD